MRRMDSAVIFGLGMVYGLVGCAASLKAFFCLGANDTMTEVVALILCFPGMLIAAVLGFWRRRVAGIVYLVLPEIFLFGMVRQYLYMTQVRHFDQGPFLRYLLQLCVLCVPLWLVGGFALWTALRGWPEVFARNKGGEDAEQNRGLAG